MEYKSYVVIVIKELLTLFANTYLQQKKIDMGHARLIRIKTIIEKTNGVWTTLDNIKFLDWLRKH